MAQEPTIPNEALAKRIAIATRQMRHESAARDIYTMLAEGEGGATEETVATVASSAVGERVAATVADADPERDGAEARRN